MNLRNSLSINLNIIFSTLLVLIYLFGIEFNLVFLITYFFASLFLLLGGFKKSFYGSLFLLFLLVYFLPFIHLLEYLAYDFTSERLYFWGVASNEYMFNKKIICLLTIFGIISITSFNVTLIFSKSSLGSAHKKITFNKGMNFYIWCFFLLIGFVSSVLSAPSDSLFVSDYMSVQSSATNANFGSLWMFSYILVSFCFIDAYKSRGLPFFNLKRALVISVIIYIVVVLQLMRGDRESLTWVIALFITYWKLSGRTILKIRTPQMIFGTVVLILLVFINSFVGFSRSLFSEYSFVEIFNLFMEDAFNTEAFAFLFHGTWSAVLLTPLSVAGDYIYNIHEFKLGLDYIDIILSTPPGFISDLFGYVRPLDSGQGPAWEMKFGLGGTHSSVLPFRNFGLCGLFLIQILISYLVIRVDKRTRKSELSLKDYTLFLTIALVMPHWLWYGEKYMLNALIYWLLISILFSSVHRSLNFSMK